MRLFGLSPLPLLLSCAVVTAVAGMARSTWREVRREARLSACGSLGDELRRAALVQLAEQDEVEELPRNPARLPENAGRLQPDLPGWAKLARAFPGPVYGQYAVAATATGFEVTVRCVPLPGEPPTRFVGTEAHRLRPDTDRAGELSLTRVRTDAVPRP